MFLVPWKAHPGKEEETRARLEIFDIPEDHLFLSSCTHILGNVYGFTRSLKQNMAVDGEGDLLPMYTYPTIEYLRQLDFSGKSVFEFGSGYSTQFWTTRAEKVIAVENKRDWYDKVQAAIGEKATIVLDETEDFPNRILDFDETFDVIVVDSAGHRYDCADRAVKKLAEGGMIILDNSDWHHQTAARLRQADLIQIDMTGFKPLEYYTSTTSLFLHRAFSLQAREDRQPHYGMGAKRSHSAAWDRPQSKPSEGDGSR